MQVLIVNEIEKEQIKMKYHISEEINVFWLIKKEQ
jgi:hypothetical protein